MRVKDTLLMGWPGTDLRTLGGEGGTFGGVRPVWKMRTAGGGGGGVGRADFDLPSNLPSPNRSSALECAASPPPKRFAKGDKVLVAPPTTANRKRMEEYVGSVVEVHASGEYTVKGFGERARGRKVPGSWVRLQNTFGATPLSGERTGIRSLSAKAKERVVSAAKREVQEELSLMAEEVGKLKEANLLLEQHYEKRLKKLADDNERRNSKLIAALLEDHARKVAAAETEAEAESKVSTRLRRKIAQLEWEAKEWGSSCSQLKDKMEKYRKLKNSAASEKRNLRRALDIMKLRNKLKVKRLQEKVDAARQAAAEFVDEAQKRDAAHGPCCPRRTAEKGRPYPIEFEHHARALMATGMSAETCRQTIALNAKYFMTPEQYDKMDLPSVGWFRMQREGAGAETTLLQWVRIAGCDDVVQYGFDETNVNGIATFNQWALISENGKLSIVVIECGGILCGSTADEIADHIQRTWKRGHEMVAALRQELGEEEKADRLVPLNGGGVAMAKIWSTIHDTCNLANAIPRRLKVMKEASGREVFGDEAWDARALADKAFLDFLCGNHTRNLPVDAFTRLFAKYLQDNLSEEFATAAASQVNSRLEMDGVGFLRSIAKLVHSGYDQYEKGDGLDFKEFLSRKYPHLTNKLVGRVELSKRQDWVLEFSATIFPLLEAIIEYNVECIELGPHTLRDSVLLRLELHHFEAFVHAAAVMWETCFKELRGLTNSTKVDLNPCELHNLYDELWAVALVLKGPDPMSVLDGRPWAKVKPHDPAVQKFYRDLEIGLTDRKLALQLDADREDSGAYEEVLCDVLRLFGEGITESLTRTMGDYLEATNGKLRNSTLSVEEAAKAESMLCHNNHAERPFAVIKALAKQYPSMSLRHLASVANSKVLPASPTFVTMPCRAAHLSFPSIVN